MLRAANPTNVDLREPRTTGAENMLPNANLKVPSSVEDGGRIVVEHRTKDSFGCPIVKRYVRGPLLGKGGFAKCYQFTDADTGRIWAGKVVAKSSLVKQRHKAKVGWGVVVCVQKFQPYAYFPTFCR